jgi:uncharacterized protein
MSAFIIAGYASLFGTPDLAGDIVAKGAFARSLDTLPAPGIRMLWQHDPDRPIGQWLEVVEDDHGLWVRGQIEAAHAEARHATQLIRAGLVDGLSIGFRTLKAQLRPAGGRILEEIDLREVSLVAFPMLPRARLRVRPAPSHFPTQTQLAA